VRDNLPRRRTHCSAALTLAALSLARFSALLGAQCGTACILRLRLAAAHCDSREDGEAEDEIRIVSAALIRSASGGWHEIKERRFAERCATQRVADRVKIAREGGALWLVILWRALREMVGLFECASGDCIVQRSEPALAMPGIVLVFDIAALYAVAA
jgi:hypothetical protein